jgi:hypothetical protein
MASYPFPRYLLWHCDTMTVDDLRRAAQSALVIARVKVTDWTRQYLIMQHGKARFVLGEWSGAICGPDLDSALSRGKVLHVWEAAGYEGAGLFQGWADWIWCMRKVTKACGDHVASHVAKMMSVSLWGQFAQRLERYEAASDIPAPRPYGEFWHHPLGTETAVKCRAIAGRVDKLVQLEEGKDSIPSISCFVAAYARAYMQGMRAIAGEHTVVYQVADSLHVTDDGLERLQAHGLVCPDTRGKLKIAKQVQRTTYLAANTMVQDGELTAAGIYGKGEQVSPGHFRWRLPRRLAQSIVLPPMGTVEAPEVSRSVRS